MTDEESAKIQLSSDVRTKEGDEELEALAITNYIMRILGLRCPPSKSGRRRWVSILRRIPPIAFIIHGIIFVIILIAKIKQYSTFDMGVAMGTSLVIWMTSSILSVAYLLRWDAIRLTRGVALLISEASDQSGAKAAKARMRFRAVVHLAATIILVISSILFQGASIFGNYAPYLSTQFNGTVIGSTYRYFDYAGILLVFYGASSWCLATSLATLIFASVFEEFQDFNRKLRECDTWNVRTVQELSAAYFRLAKVVDYLNPCFSSFLFVMLSADIANFVFQIYSLVTGWSQQNSIVCAFLMLTAVFILLRFLAFSLSPAKMHEVALDSTLIIAKAIDCGTVAADAELYRAASWFIQKVTSHPVGITVGGFCIITKPLLLTVVSVVVTYLILLVQMAQETGSTFRNGTLNE